jgi:hypothetical protein
MQCRPHLQRMMSPLLSSCGPTCLTTALCRCKQEETSTATKGRYMAATFDVTYRGKQQLAACKEVTPPLHLLSPLVYEDMQDAHRQLCLVHGEDRSVQAVHAAGSFIADAQESEHRRGLVCRATPHHCQHATMSSSAPHLACYRVPDAGGWVGRGVESWSYVVSSLPWHRCQASWRLHRDKSHAHD